MATIKTKKQLKAIIRECILQEADDGKIEAHGVKGMKSVKWRKTFKNQAALDKWVEANDAEVQGTRRLDESKKHVIREASGKKYKLSSGEILQVHDEHGQDMDGSGRSFTTLSINGQTIPWKRAEEYASMIINPRDKKAVMGMIDNINKGRY